MGKGLVNKVGPWGKAYPVYEAERACILQRHVPEVVGIQTSFLHEQTISPWKDWKLEERTNRNGHLYYAYADGRRHQRDRAETLKTCSERVLWGLATLARRNAQIANDAVHSIQEKGVSELPARSFDDDCRSVCKLLREQLNERYGADVCFEVSYVARDEQIDWLAVKMLAGNATRHGERFTVEGVTRYPASARSRYDFVLFRQHDKGVDASEGPRVLLTKKEVQKAFYIDRGRIRGRKGQANEMAAKDYAQYVALPVVCPAVEGQTKKKMIGLLQVAVTESEIWKNVEEVKEMAGDYMIPFACQLLMIHKLRNSLRAAPKKQNPALSG